MIRRAVPRRHRLLPRAGLGIVAVMGAALAIPPAPVAAEEAVQARAALIEGGARVVFDWPAPVAFTTTVSGTRVTVSFERPLAATFDGVLQALPDRIVGMEIAGNGQSVVLTLAEPSHVTSFARGDLVVLDLTSAQGDPPVAVAQTPDPAPETSPAVPPGSVAEAPSAPTSPSSPASSPPASSPSASPSSTSGEVSPPSGSVAETPPPPRIVDGMLSVRYGLHDAYDRIVFDWPERVPYTVTNNGGLIEVRFEAGARIDGDALAARLPSRLRLVGVDSTAGSLTVTLAAPPGARVNDFYNYTKTVIDIYRDPSGAPPVAVPAAPDQIAAAEPETVADEPLAADATPAVPGVPADATDAGGDSDAAGVPAAAEEAPAHTADASDETADAPPETADQPAGGPAAPPVASGGNAAVLATLPPSPGPSPGRRPQFDAAAPVGETPAVEPPPVEPAGEPQGVEEPQQTAAPMLAATEEPPLVPDRSVPEAADTGTPEPPASPAAEPDPPVRSAAVEPGSDAEPADQADSVGPPTVDVVVIDGDFEALMRLRWSEPVRAAVVRRGDRIWVAFDRPAADFDMAAVEAGAGPIYDDPVLVDGDGLLFSVRVESEVEPRVTASGNTWYVQLRPRRSESSLALFVERFDDPVLGAAIAFSSADPPLDPSEPITIDDPEIGDRFVMVPVGVAGAGLPRAAAYIQFHVMASAQGLAFDRLSDDVLVRSEDGRVEVLASGGLTLSDDQATRAASPPQHGSVDELPAGSDAEDAPAGIAAEAPVPASAATPRGGVTTGFRLFDQEAWRLDAHGRFAEISRQLQAEAAAADGPAARAEARARFARFLFGHNQFRDAGGVLRLIASDSPQAYEADASLRALRGATSFMNGQIDDAVIDLSDGRLLPSGEAQYWRAAALAAQGQHEQADRLFAEAEAPEWYDPGLRIPLALAEADTALLLDDVQGAAGVLDSLPYFGLDQRLAAEVAMRRATVAWRRGDVGGAEEAWSDAIAGGSAELAARAVFDRTAGLFGAGMMTASEAAVALDAMRYNARGSAIELDLLQALAEYEFAAGDYRSGFRTLKHARAIVSADADRVRIDNRLQAAFSELFGPAPPANISPVTSIALFSEFADLAPRGAARDEMLRRLAGRLVAIDLYGEAAKVLHGLLLDEVVGPARGELGRDLAVLYLAADQPQAAVDVLLETRSRDFSALLDQERRHLRASGHLALADYPTALAALDEDESPAADMLRAEIHWRQGDWAAAGAVFGRLVEGESFAWPPEPAPIGPAPLGATTPVADQAADGPAGALAVPGLLSAEEAAAIDAQPAVEDAAAPPRQPAGFAAHAGPLGDFAAEQVLNWAMALTYADDQLGLAYLRQRYGDAMAATSHGDMFRMLVADAFGPIESVADLGRVGPSIDMFETFLSSYRDRLARELAEPLTDQPGDPAAAMDDTSPVSRG